MYSKSFIKIIGILLLIVRFAKSSDQTIVQIIRKNKSILMFLTNPSNCFTGTYLKPSQHLRWRWYYDCGLQPSTVTKNSVLGIAGVSHPPLKLYITSHFPHLQHSVTLWLFFDFSRVLGISCSSKQTSFTSKLTSSYLNPKFNTKI